MRCSLAGRPELLPACPPARHWRCVTGADLQFGHGVGEGVGKDFYAHEVMSTGLRGEGQNALVVDCERARVASRLNLATGNGCSTEKWGGRKVTMPLRVSAVTVPCSRCRPACLLVSTRLPGVCLLSPFLRALVPFCPSEFPSRGGTGRSAVVREAF